MTPVIPNWRPTTMTCRCHPSSNHSFALTGKDNMVICAICCGSITRSSHHGRINADDAQTAVLTRNLAAAQLELQALRKEQSEIMLSRKRLEGQLRQQQLENDELTLQVQRRRRRQQQEQQRQRTADYAPPPLQVGHRSHRPHSLASKKFPMAPPSAPPPRAAEH